MREESIEMQFDYLSDLTNKVDGLDHINLQKFVKDGWVGEELENKFIANYEINKNKAELSDALEPQPSKTCILIGASPAVNKQIETLKTIDENFILVSSNKVYQLLVESGIQPDFVFAVEARPHIKTHLLCGSKGKTKLIVSPFVYPEVIDDWDGEKYFYPVGGGKRFNKIIEEDFVCRDVSGGNVINTSMVWAYKYLACRDFIIIGTSLCYYDDYYYDSAPVDTIGTDLKKWDKYFACDIYGKAVKTTPVLTMYKTWFECYSKYANCNFINATEDGILGVYLDPINYDKESGDMSFRVKYIPWINIVPLDVAIKGYKLKFKEKLANVTR